MISLGKFIKIEGSLWYSIKLFKNRSFDKFIGYLMNVMEYIYDRIRLFILLKWMFLFIIIFLYIFFRKKIKLFCVIELLFWCFLSRINNEGEKIEI